MLRSPGEYERPAYAVPALRPTLHTLQIAVETVLPEERRKAAERQEEGRRRGGGRTTGASARGRTICAR